MYIHQREEQALFYPIFAVHDLLVLVACWRKILAEV